MDKDTGVASYMNQRAQCMKYIASLALAQMLALCVFLVLYWLLQSEFVPGRWIGVARTVIRAAFLVVTGVLCVANLLGVVKIRMLDENYPDKYSVAGEKSIISEAYSIAKEVLMTNNILALLIMLLGILAWLIIRTVTVNSDMGEVLSQAVMSASAGIALFIFIQSFDRIVTYKVFLGERYNADLQFNIPVLSSAAIGIPLTFCIYYQWRYYGSDRNLAWITFFAAFILITAIGVLINIAKKSSTSA